MTTAFKEVRNPNCDGSHCGYKAGKVKRLSTGKMSNLNVCYHCYWHEIHWREDENKRLSQDYRYSLPSWDELEEAA
jgi:hypothetical protein